jgi:hypothetical protein
MVKLKDAGNCSYPGCISFCGIFCLRGVPLPFFLRHVSFNTLKAKKKGFALHIRGLYIDLCDGCDAEGSGFPSIFDCTADEEVRTRAANFSLRDGTAIKRASATVTHMNWIA